MKTQSLYRIAIILSLIVCFTCSKDSTEEDAIFDPELYTYVPDDNFEDFLIERGYDNKMDNYVLTSNIENIEELSLAGCVTYACIGLDISDLTGIQDFRSLKFLSCRYNRLTTLDVSKNTALSDLICSDNDLTTLNLSQNTELVTLDCSGNRLTSLDVSNNINLWRIKIGDANFHTGNEITNIDISKNLNLKIFDCTNNNLTELDVSNNVELFYLNCANNNIECIQVNQYQMSSSNWYKDPETIYSLDCNY